MDPDQTLAAIRAAIGDYCTTDDDDAQGEAAMHFINAFEALDGWLSKQGFLPAEWMGAAFGPRVTD